MAEDRMREEFRRQLFNFINALIAISPSRNYVTQFLYVIRMNGSIDYRILEDAYPDIVKDDYVREAFARIFGIYFADKVSLDMNGYGWFLTNFIEHILKLFESSEFRAKIYTLLKDEFPEGIPNLAREWLEARLRGLRSEPNYGESSIRVLREIVKIERMKLEELEKKLGLGRGRLLQCLDLLNLYKLIEKDYDGSFKPSELLRKYREILEEV